MKLKSIHTFKVNASRNTSLYWVVNVWKNINDMQKHCDWVKLGKNCKGACSPFTRTKITKNRTITSPQLGEINLLKNWLTMEVITHESVHAGLNYLERKKVSRDKKGKGGLLTNDSFDELLCYSVGYIGAEIVRGVRKVKLIE